ncbi:MAG: DUF3109 family protein [Bacteroidales bacterium]|jgi:hypothetical protein|nr:DUF3109 family protein [Bacteroidales bacterium]MDD2204652.1 DUF3109 family protein [Bacteroidales bacterium]MDD3151326.1 DUF3109 family protein [Bacteroidales bacterium]MDD3913673.1 DUF3109 family protein [Bacteroidales bacterium]MDD4633924.1 DUF3109 family protein [Bacteroidales bacterium]
MLVVQNCLLSDDIKNVDFCCDLTCCKGRCCIEGDVGAPLEEEEVSQIEDYIDEIMPFMTAKGIDVVKSMGVFDYGVEGEYVTPLIDDKDCAFICYEDGIAKCAIEKAYNQGVIPHNKPISCHLYPIRLSKYQDVIALNYDKWSVCKDAATFGHTKNIKLYEFLKEPLIRKFGKQWYDELLEEIKR